MSGQRLVEDTGARLWATAGQLVTHPKFSQELGEAIRRPRGAEQAITAMLVHFRLVAPSVPVEMTVPIASTAKTVSTTDLVEAMIAAGVHRFAKRPGGGRRCMGPDEYRALWPSEVTYPAGYADRYPHILLADQTVPPAKLKELCAAFTDFYTNPGDCRVLPKVPKFLIGRDSKRLARAIVFWGYEQNLGRNVKDCRLEISSAHIPLIGNDGMWILVEYRDNILRHHAIDLPGSGFGDSLAPYVDRFDHARSRFGAGRVDFRFPRFGSGFRGSEFISLS